MGRKKKSKYPVNEKSFFATPESVGVYWQGIRKGRQKHDTLKGSGAIHLPKSITGVVVVNPTAAAM